MKGNLYLIPTTLGENNFSEVIPPHIIEIIEKVDVFVVENIRTSRRYISSLKISKAIREIEFLELNKNTDIKEISGFLQIIFEGKNMGLISEAGCPAVADPGMELIRIAHMHKIKVVPLVGPSSILLALMASGMNGQNFAFSGYLPIKNPQRVNRIRFLEKRAMKENQAQIFMETPYRCGNLLEQIVQTCNSQTRLCIACDLTLKNESIETRTIAEWKKDLPDINKRLVIFVLGF
ncbi:MAG: SAM-dependent methyltransferase [Bacteroidetes bacterium]|jgi:16S rRNA (cytidine1402-2'-O)-methyltransferase|nr:SAM-dependent methyltransferase [Bacteroidota bacterium]MBT6686266.1 SAM-dependent methyltransferase [Bacteroidota bacterium]MBT7142640.1 SAM-dependent methyltransferase [Bacteroidota bacterium]MBT7492774.1 SAM-dependent methyltransferase [Bacteroidota bacterium]